jgi:hypothetical protein
MAAWRMLTWELVAQQRWLFWPSAAYLALISLVCPLLPAHWRSEDLGISLVLILVAPTVPLVACLADGHGRLEGRSSCYPRRRFTLPVPAAVLAGPSLLLGTVVVVTAWLLCAGCVLRPCGIPASVFWPAAAMAAGLAWLQALMWSPFRWPGLRLLIMSVLVFVLWVGSIVLMALNVSEATLTACLAALVPPAYVAAVVAVARARHGAGWEEPGSIEAGALNDFAEPLPAFSSSLWAQLWLEWRLNRAGIILLTCFNLFWTVALTHMWMLLLRQEYAQDAFPELVQTGEQTGVGWLCVQVLVLGPLVMSLAMGVDLGRMTQQSGSFTLPRFFAALPLDAASMVRGKVVFAGLLMLVSWLFAAAAGLGWAAWTGHLADMTDRLVAAAGSGPAALALLAVGFVLAVLVSWLWTVRELWAALAGWIPLMWLPPALSVATCVAVALAAGWWLRSPEVPPVLVWLIGAALLLKAAATGWVIRKTRRRGLLSAGVLAGAVVGWLVVATATAGLVCWLAGEGAALFAGVMLLVPLARPLAAPLALAHNRHR